MFQSQASFQIVLTQTIRVVFQIARFSIINKKKDRHLRSVIYDINENGYVFFENQRSVKSVNGDRC